MSQLIKTRHHVLLTVLLAALTSAGCYPIPPVHSSPRRIDLPTTIELGANTLQLTLPAGRSKDFEDRSALRSVSIDSTVGYDKWGALDLLEKYWDYERTLTGSSFGTLRLAVRVRMVDSSMRFDPDDLQSFQSTVTRLSIQQAQEFAANLKQRGYGLASSNEPVDFRTTMIGRENWVAYDQKDTNTQIFARPLDPTHFVEFVFSYISNSKNNSWSMKASKDADRVLASVVIVRH